MPIYVYKFIETGETVEISQSFNDPTLSEAVHPRTGETMAVKKVFQPVGVTFRGGGFYRNDSRGSSSSSTSTSSSNSGGSNSDSGASSAPAPTPAASSSD